MGVAMRFFQVQVAGLLASTCGAGERPKQPFPERPLCGDYNSKTRAENSPQYKRQFGHVRCQDRMSAKGQ